MMFLFVGSLLCYRLPPHKASRLCSCLSLVITVHLTYTEVHLQGTYTLLVHAHAGRTQLEPTKGSHLLAHFGGLDKLFQISWLGAVSSFAAQLGVRCNPKNMR